jgi:hypothetical protein
MSVCRVHSLSVIGVYALPVEVEVDVGVGLPGSSSQEDIISWGVLGLLDAIETFDPDRPGKKAKVESYAISKIRWPSWMRSRAKTGCPGVYVCAHRK